MLDRARSCCRQSWPKLGRGALIVSVLLFLLSGCNAARNACDRGCVAGKVGERTGFTFGPPPPCDGNLILPNGATLDDGLTEEEAIIIALWNNAAFQELLTDLGIARGDLVQAGLLPNPEVIYFLPMPDKPYKYAFDLPIEAFWLRPIRLRAAAREVDRVCERLTQAGLDLIRDVRVAYADVLLAQGRLDVAREAVRIRGEIARFAEIRLKAGDISAQEATTARIDHLVAQQDAVRIAYDVSLAEERLRNLMASGLDRSPLQLLVPPPPMAPELDDNALVADAIGTRPDALAAEENAEAARERLRLSRLVWFRFLGILDATSGNFTGHDFGPAARFTLPIFNWNQGNIARADADWDKAERQRLTVRNQIVLDVHLANYRYRQARAELEILDNQVMPEAETAIQRAEKAYREGHTPYVVVLETTRQLLDSLLRRTIIHAELRRSWAELERSVGRRLDVPTAALAEKEPAP